MKKLAIVLFVAAAALSACGGKAKKESTMDTGSGSASGSAMGSGSDMGGSGYGGGSGSASGAGSASGSAM
jgi:hypothetical protein